MILETPQSDIEYLTDPAPVKIVTPAGWWRFRPTFAARPATAVTAELFLDGMKTPVLQVRAGLWDLEQQLGFLLPKPAQERLLRATPHPHFVAVFTGLDPETVTTRGNLRPWRASRVDLTGTTPTTYGRLCHADKPLRSWHDPAHNITVDIVNAARVPLGNTWETRLAYRIHHEDLVVFAGTQLALALHDPTSDDAIRHVAQSTVLTAPTTGPLTARQKVFLDAHGADLVHAVAAVTTPRPGTRIAVQGPPGLPGATGVMVGKIDSAAESHYVWRPDVADLPGHPWRHRPSRHLTTPASRVTPTLQVKDTAVGGDHHVPYLAYGARVQTIDDPRTAGGTVLRLFHGDGRPYYEIQPDEAHPPLTINVDDVVATAGTAWPTIGSLLDARQAAGLQLSEGELLVTLRETAPVIDSTAGPIPAPTRPLLCIDPALDPDILALASDHAALSPASPPPPNTNFDL